MRFGVIGHCILTMLCCLTSLALQVVSASSATAAVARGADTVAGARAAPPCLSSFDMVEMNRTLQQMAHTLDKLTESVGYFEKRLTVVEQEKASTAQRVM